MISTYKKVTAFILFLVAILAALLIYRVAMAEPTTIFHSTSIRMDGTYDGGHVMFSWTPSQLPGYQIDLATYPNCVGEVEVDRLHRYCVNIAYYEPGNNSYYFIAYIHPTTVCGHGNVTLEPFLAVYHSSNRTHDVIYGDVANVSYSWCKDVELPIIMNSGSGQTSVGDPYP